MGLAENLTSIMHSKRISQVELAKLSKVSRWTIAQIQNGKTDASHSTILKIASALGISAAELLGDKVTPPSSLANEKTNSDLGRIEAKIADLEKEMIRGFARIEAMIQMKK